MQTIELTLYGTPVAKGRPRFTRNGHTYTDAKTKGIEALILAEWLAEAPSSTPHDGPVTVELVATFTPAPSWPKWKRELAMAGGLPHTQKPDVDNLLKVIDGLNGHAWRDDSQIVDAVARKRFGPFAQTRITITLHPTTSDRKH